MRNVVVICLDSVRKDYFEKFSKRLINRADHNITQCRAASSWSVPSHASLLTGQLPSNHGVHSHNMNFRGIESDTIMNQLSNYETTCISANGFTTEEFGFDYLFDNLISISQGQRYPTGMHAGGKSVRQIIKQSIDDSHTFYSLANGTYSKLYWLMDALPIPSLFDQGASQIRKISHEKFDDQSKPVFLFTNFMEGHLPHQPTLHLDSKKFSIPWSWTSTDFDHFEFNIRGDDNAEKYSTDVKHFRELYSANIEYLDRQINKFIDDILNKANRKTTFIITSDHGENLGFQEENYLMAHSSSLSEGLLHVPLLVINPPSNLNLENDSYLSHLSFPDLVNSIINNTQFHCTSEMMRAELIGGGAKIKGDEQFWDRMIRCVYDDEYKYTWDSNGEASKFKLNHNKLSSQEIIEMGISLPEDIEKQFETNIREYKKNAKGSGEKYSETDIQQSTEENLKDLGYL